jgi:hypothetical protein
MTQLSLTLQEAQELCGTYQHLIGQRLFPDKDWTIDCVAVAPADRLSQWLFAHFYLECGCPRSAIRFYKTGGYSVIALSVRDRRPESIVFRELSACLAEQAAPEERDAPRVLNRTVESRSMNLHR